jgi:hypothetical protein
MRGSGSRRDVPRRKGDTRAAARPRTDAAPGRPSVRRPQVVHLDGIAVPRSRAVRAGSLGGLRLVSHLLRTPQLLGIPRCASEPDEDGFQDAHPHKRNRGAAGRGHAPPKMGAPATRHSGTAATRSDWAQRRHGPEVAWLSVSCSPAPGRRCARRA